MKLYYPITVDLYNIYPLHKINAQQNNIGRGALITLTAAGTVIDPSDENVTLYAKKADGMVSYIPCIVSDGKIKADFTNQMLALSGDVWVELLLISGSEQISTPIFVISVHATNINEKAIESKNEFTALQEAISNMNTAFQEVDDLKKNGLKGDPGAVYTPSVSDSGDLSWSNNGELENPPTINIKGPKGDPGEQGEPGQTQVLFSPYSEFPTVGDSEKIYVDTSNSSALILYRWNGTEYILSSGGVDLSLIAPEFDQDQSYVAGEYVTHENGLWRFTQSKETGEWDSTVVTSTSVGAELGALNSNNVELIAQLKTDSSSETVVSCPDLNKYRELIFEIYPGAYDSGTVDGVVSQYHNRKYFQELNHPMIVSWPSDFYFRFAYVSNTSIKIYVSDAWSRSCKIYGIY